MKLLLLTLALQLTQLNAKNRPLASESTHSMNSVTASFNASATTLCTGETLFLTNTSSGATSYEWRIDNVLYATTLDASWMPLQAGSFSVELVAFDATCSDTSSLTVVVNTTPVVNAGPDVFLCPDAAPCQILTPTITAGAGPFTYDWSPGAGLNDSTILNPCARPDTTTVYTLIATSLSSGCSSQPDSAAMVTVVVHPQPIANAGVDTTWCTGDTINLNGIGSGAGPQYLYQWFPFTGLSDPSIPNPQAYPSQPTTYTLTVWSNACPSHPDTITVSFAPQQGPNADFSVSNLGGQVFQFQDASSGPPTSWLWELNCNAISSPLINVNPSWTDTLPGCEFEVCLTVANEVGCGDRHCDSISVPVALENELDVRFNVYPIPANEHLRVEWDQQLEEKLKWSVLDLQGKELLSGEVMARSVQSLDLDLSHLPTAAYLLKLESNGRGYRQQILKVR